MKKMFIYSMKNKLTAQKRIPVQTPKASPFRWGGFGSLFLGLILISGCAYTDMGQRVNAERESVAEMENRRSELESRLVIVMNNLELNPDDETLSREKDKVQAKLRSVEEQLAGRRQMFDQILKEWDQKIVEERIQKRMIDTEVRDNARKDEYEWEDKEQGKN
jgi:hypothetical protein